MAGLWTGLRHEKGCSGIVHRISIDSRQPSDNRANNHGFRDRSGDRRAEISFLSFYSLRNNLRMELEKILESRLIDDTCYFNL